MKKTISGVLLALTAVFALVACKKNKKDDKTTKDSGKTTEAGTTTKAIPAGNGKTIEFYCWNDEFQTRLRKYYKDADGKKVETITPTIDLMGDGTKIKWTMVANEGSAYQDALDSALDGNKVDMFCFEADYAKKYIEKTDKVAKLSDLGIATTAAENGQYQYTIDAVTNAAGDVMGSSWQACPGAIAYNQNVATAAFGENGTYEKMDAALSTDKATFDTTAAKLEAKHNKYAMMIGPADWYRVYSNNISGKMYNKTTNTITVDKNIFQYAVDTKAYNDNGYILGDSAAYGLWGNSWNAAMNADSNALTMFVCPWFTDFCMAGNCPAQYTNPDDKTTLIPESQPWRVVKGYDSWFWGGTWLTATKAGLEDATKKAAISSIVKVMTTDKATLRALSDGELDFTNNKAAMDEKAADPKVKNEFFGGMNVYSIYAESVLEASLANASDYDQQIAENFQGLFLPYIQGKSKASACWTNFIEALKKVNKDFTVNAAEGVTVADDITIA